LPMVSHDTARGPVHSGTAIIEIFLDAQSYLLDVFKVDGESQILGFTQQGMDVQCRYQAEDLPTTRTSATWGPHGPLCDALWGSATSTPRDWRAAAS
jgi:hypothetical protein